MKNIIKHTLFNLLISLFFMQEMKIAFADSSEQLYKTGRLTEAISLLQQTIRNRQQQKDSLGEANATRNLALIYQKLGKWQEAQETILRAIAISGQINDKNKRKSSLAQALDVRGQIELSLGQSDRALETWKQATKLYQEIGDLTRLTKSQIYQAQALQSLGLYAQAIKTLTQIQQTLESKPDTLIKSQAFLNLGDVLRRVGKYTESQTVLEKSLEIAQKLKEKQAIADAFLSLGKTARLQQKESLALEYYQQAIASSPLTDLKILAQLEKLNLLIAQKEWQQATETIPKIEQLLTQTSTSQISINSWISLAKNVREIESEKENTSRQVSYLTTAIQQAQSIDDRRSLADALGNLGTLYEQYQRYEEAQKLTEQALTLAQGIQATDLTYQWQWQLGRILNAEGDRENAILAYSAAVKTLQSLRGDLVAISSQLQFSFRKSVEPVYREFAGLLLQPNATQEDLKQARDVIEALQLAELDNFFRDACLDAKPVQIDRLDPTAAIFYTIILSDRLEVIVALSDRPLRRYATSLSQAQIEQNLFVSNSVIQSVGRSPNLQPLQELYDWLIRPIEADLTANNIKTLVFIPDGALRNIPPAILHDGKQYLVEKYNLAIAPSLQLIDPQPLVAQKNRGILLAGLTEARQGFIALPGVQSELESIKVEFPSQILLNNSFTEANFDTILRDSPYQLVHLATHGQFSSKAEETFILTWDNLININELNSLLRADRQQIRPIELLVLSACQTAAGDEQAVLGLAGIAVRAGARSTVASLWDVSDESTTLLMRYFYQELAQNNLPKAEALRRAQLRILQTEKFSHPYFWSAFILVGNWL
jgi:CHAT domain-containing protein/tetratricopeptide (TPR) repeat protein